MDTEKVHIYFFGLSLDEDIIRMLAEPKRRWFVLLGLVAIGVTLALFAHFVGHIFLSFWFVESMVLAITLPTAALHSILQHQRISLEILLGLIIGAIYIFELALWFSYIPAVANLPDALRANDSIWALGSSIWAIGNIGHALLFFGAALTTTRDQLNPHPGIIQTNNAQNLFTVLLFISITPVILMTSFTQLNRMPLW